MNAHRLNWILAFALSSGLAYGAPQKAAEPGKPAAATPVRKPTFAAVSYGHRACQPGERWAYGPAVPQDVAEAFEESLGQDLSAVQGFSEGLATRRFAKSAELRTLGEYWISRSLYDVKLLHIAMNGFNAIVARAPTRETAGIQTSALNCMLQIHSRYPAIAFPDAVAPHFKSYLELTQNPLRKGVVLEAISAHLRGLVSRDSIPWNEVERTADLLQGSGAHEAFARGIIAARKKDHSTAIHQFTKFFNATNLPDGLKRFVDSAHILMARSSFAKKQYDKASNHLKLVKKSSNDLGESLSELAWAFLMDERYPEAIGTAVNLQGGGMSRTFTPEAPMVMAMALNELCQYPESVRTVNLFRKQYETSWRWLNHWKQGKNQESSPAADNAAESMSLYQLAVAHVKKQKKVPERIGGEWVRSPLFISSQDEINLLIDEKQGCDQLGHRGANEQNLMYDRILKFAGDLKIKIASFRKQSKERQELPKSLRNDLVKLKRQIIRFERMRQAAPVWQVILDNYRNQAPQIQTKNLAKIEQDLKQRSLRMLAQIEEVAENIQLIEVEIYNGASQDIIWQNAHPDYKKIASQFKEENRAPASLVWNWGKLPANIEDGGEMWEDELGSFKANLFNNCSSKDKYLALKREQIMQAMEKVK